MLHARGNKQLLYCTHLFPNILNGAKYHVVHHVVHLSYCCRFNHIALSEIYVHRFFSNILSKIQTHTGTHIHIHTTEGEETR